MNTELRKSLTLIEFDKAERKNDKKMDEKFLALNEQSRLDRNDFNNKLATFKADVSLMTFDRETSSFLKNTIYTGWGDLVFKCKEYESKIEKNEVELAKLTRIIKMRKSTVVSRTTSE